MNIKELQSDIESTKGLEEMALSLTEIGSLELRKLRQEVVDHQVFFKDLNYIFSLLRYFTRHLSSLKKTGNGKTITILLTSNERHFGKISGVATDFFIDFTRQTNTDRIVIGSQGISYLRARKYNQSITNIVFRSDNPTPDELKKLTMLVKDYSHILVIYCEFKSIMVQLPIVKDITQRQMEAQKEQEVKKFVYTFILEPEIGKIMDFFNSQIIHILISGHLLEAQLARVASRLISMDQAQQNAKEILLKQTAQLTGAKRNLLNKQILETWAAVKASYG